MPIYADNLSAGGSGGGDVGSQQLELFGPNYNNRGAMIANDGNFLVNPVILTELDQQATGERYDIVVDFSSFRVGDTIKVVNLLQQTNGRMPDFDIPVAQALAEIGSFRSRRPIMQPK